VGYTKRLCSSTSALTLLSVNSERCSTDPQATGLKLKPSKCSLLQQEDKYLGYVVGRHRITTNPEKVRAVRDSAVPPDLPSLQVFLELVGYYRQYILNFARYRSAVKPDDSKRGHMQSNRHSSTLKIAW